MSPHWAPLLKVPSWILHKSRVSPVVLKQDSSPPSYGEQLGSHIPHYSPAENKLETWAGKEVVRDVGKQAKKTLPHKAIFCTKIRSQEPLSYGNTWEHVCLVLILCAAKQVQIVFG